jgi:hypothetical protein
MAETPNRTPLAIHTRRLTLFGRSSVLIAAVVLANVGCWILAGLTFSQTDGLVNLAFLAWVCLVKRMVLMIDPRSEART